MDIEYRISNRPAFPIDIYNNNSTHHICHIRTHDKNDDENSDNNCGR